MGIFDIFKFGLKKSATNFTEGLREIIIKKEIDDQTLNEIEEFLIKSDVGLEAAEDIRGIISQKKIDPKKNLLGEVNNILKQYIFELMRPLEKKDFFDKTENMKTIIVSGVNGVGKTTTIGKLGKILKSNGNKILFSASDTFRAAAIDQLDNWSKKIEEAKNNNYSHVLIDTAGRLQNKKNLMEEYKKISNVTKKIDEKSPHEVILVLDATSGQNIITQVEEFNRIIPITGLVMTKLDGTAKGGILIAISKKFKLPILALGMGEKEDDLQIFDAKIFSDSFIGAN